MLLGSALLAHASDNNQTPLVPNALTPLAQNDELDSAELQFVIDTINQVHSDELAGAEPQLDSGEKNAKQKEVLNSAVLKFSSMPRMRSSIVLIYDENGKKPLHSKNADVVAPIASITKLMTAMVVLDAKLPLDEEISLSPLVERPS